MTGGVCVRDGVKIHGRRSKPTLRAAARRAYCNASDAMNPEARCRAGRPCLEGSESRNRLSELLAWPVFFEARKAGGYAVSLGRGRLSPMDCCHDLWLF